MIYLIYYISPLLLFLCAKDYYTQRSIISKAINVKCKKIIWITQYISLYIYFIVLIKNIFEYGEIETYSTINNLLLIACLFGLIQRNYKLIQTLEDILKGILEFTIICFILGGAQATWIVTLSILILSINAGKNKLKSNLWVLNGTGLIRFLTCPWLSRKWIIDSTRRAYINLKYFRYIIKSLNFLTPWIQISAILIIFSTILNITIITKLLVILQIIFGLGLYITADLKWIPFLYSLLFVIHYQSSIYIYKIYNVGIQLRFLDFLLILFIILYSFNSLTGESNPNKLLYKFRGITKFLTFYAFPLRLYCERELVNIITFHIRGHKNIEKFNAFDNKGFRKNELILSSNDQKKCILFSLGDFCYLSSKNGDPEKGFSSELHFKQCSNLFKIFKDCEIDFYQHCFIEKECTYESRNIAALKIISDGSSRGYRLDFQRRDKISPMKRFN